MSGKSPRSEYSEFEGKSPASEEEEGFNEALYKKALEDMRKEKEKEAALAKTAKKPPAAKKKT